MQAFFGAPHGGRRERGQNAGGRGGSGGGGRQAAGRLAVTESLARSAMVRSGGGPLPARETAMLVAMVNHPALLDDYFTDNETYNPPADVLARCTVFHDLGDFIEVFNDAWTKVKGA